MRIIPFLLLICWQCDLIAQSSWMQRFYDYHPECIENRITDRRFKHSDIVSTLKDLPPSFRVKEEGLSVEGRAIYRVSLGNGPVKVLLWSQMHGDEPTATAALMDIFRFFQKTNDGFDRFRQQIRDELTLVFIPMLNPDGAENFQRRNAQGIDLNRDALRLSSPEARILKRVRDELQADWGFNLHDQSRYYGAGYPTEHMATLSFLAPAYDFDKNINPGRERAMQLIAQINEGLQQYIPGKVARYSDAFEPRAFGDNMQKWGTNTILIESGGFPDDREKQYIRKLNFATLLMSFQSIAKQTYQSFSRKDYREIPFNKGGLFNDLLLRQLNYQHQGNKYIIDIAYDRSEMNYNAAHDFYYQGYIDDVGDLSFQQAYKTLEGNNYTVEIAQLYPDLFADIEAVRALDPNQLLREGYGVVRVLSSVPAWRHDNDKLLLVGAEGIYEQTIAPRLNPPLIIRDQSGIVRHAVINGRLFKVE